MRWPPETGRGREAGSPRSLLEKLSPADPREDLRLPELYCDHLCSWKSVGQFVGGHLLQERRELEGEWVHVCSMGETPLEASPGIGSQGRPLTLMSARWMVMPALPYLPAVLKRLGEETVGCVALGRPCRVPSRSCLCADVQSCLLSHGGLETCAF